jgi:hypothetical protein
MEDYEMTDRINSGSKYRYKRNYSNFTQTDNMTRTERRAKYPNNLDMRLTFTGYKTNKINSSKDIDMLPVLRSDDSRK